VRIKHVPGMEKWRLDGLEKLLKTGREVDGAAGDMMKEPLDNSTPRQSPGHSPSVSRRIVREMEPDG
jgi:hypothetical protein